MPSLLSRYATPAITGLFLVSLVSGVALFFHLGGGLFNEMHEWLSMVLVLPFVLHLWKNWRPMTAYLKKPPMAVALALSLLAAGLFAYQASGGGVRGGPPQMALAHRLFAHRADDLAPLLGTTGGTLIETLKKAGFAAADPALPLSEIARKSGKSEFELSAALNQPGP